MLKLSVFLLTQLFAFKDPVEKTAFHPTCIHCTPAETDANILFFTPYWKVILLPNQSFLGRALITSHRHFESYEEMSEDEAKDYHEILKVLLPLLTKSFNVTHFNIDYLMNNSYGKKHPHPPHFHWHIIPRYDGLRDFLGETFDDPDFGEMADLFRMQNMSREFLLQERHYLQDQLPISFFSLPLS